MARKVSIRRLSRELRHATDYAMWREISEALDVLDGAAAWRDDPESPHYNAEALKTDIASLTNLRASGESLKLVDALQTSLYHHQEILREPLLFGRSRVGTKHIVESYLNTIERAIEHLRDEPIAGLDDAGKLAIFRRQAQNVGRTALVLSGGATLGLFHIGVVRALWEADLLPMVVSGASTGSMIAGGLCTRTDDELREVLLNPAAAIDTRVFRMSTLSDMRRMGSLMSSEQLAGAIAANMRDDTFEEAFLRTGRVLCMSVSPTRARQKPLLLCHQTAGDVLVRSASRASCAIPGLFPSEALLRRRHGVVAEHVPGERWSDGTLEGDIPVKRLARLLNVNHTIVSQTNAHVLAFTRAQQSNGALPVVTDLVASSLAAQGLQLLNVAKRHVRQPLAHRVVARAHGIADQRYLGDITIAPRLTPYNFSVVLRNASPKDLLKLISQGQRATWPKLAEIDAATRVSRALGRSVKALESVGASTNMKGS